MKASTVKAGDVVGFCLVENGPRKRIGKGKVEKIHDADAGQVLVDVGQDEPALLGPGSAEVGGWFELGAAPKAAAKSGGDGKGRAGGASSSGSGSSS